MRNWLLTTTSKELQYYKGILIHADTYHHEQAWKLIEKYVPIGNSIIDVGAGAGAFCQRLADKGYTVTGLDIDREKWMPSGIPFVQLDIDKGIKNSINQQYDVACCFEVIEHVENPWNLMREIKAILKPGGLLILSTPNISSFLSRILFMINGKFHQFYEDDFAYGHISPISAFHLSYIAENLGWQILEISPGGYLPVFDLSDFGLKKLALNFLRGLIYPIARGYKNGWCLFFVLKNT